MKQYEVTAEFWRDGLLVEAGTVVSLSDAEAKYLQHALKAPEAQVAVEVVEEAPVAEVEVEAAPVVEVAEVVEDKPRRKRG